MTFAGPFAAPFRAPFGDVSAVPWWLQGGVAAANCIAAYQPKGAADLASSYVNLANPGTYDAFPGTAPSFNAATGWQFIRTSSTYLKTGVVPGTDQSWSAIVRFSGGGSEASSLYGRSQTTRYFETLPHYVDTNTYYRNGDGATGTKAGGSRDSGVICVAGGLAYYNGVDEGVTISAGSGTSTVTCYIGASSNASGTAIQFWTGYMQAFALYNVVLTATQAGLITTAMQAL